MRKEEREKQKERERILRLEEEVEIVRSMQPEPIMDDTYHNYIYYAIITIFLSCFALVFMIQAVYCEDYYCREGNRIKCEKANVENCDVPFHCQISNGNTTKIVRPVWNCQVYVWFPIAIHVLFYEFTILLFRKFITEFVKDRTIDNNNVIYHNKELIILSTYIAHLHIFSFFLCAIEYIGYSAIICIKNYRFNRSSNLTRYSDIFNSAATNSL